MSVSVVRRNTPRCHPVARELLHGGYAGVCLRQFRRNANLCTCVSVHMLVMGDLANAQLSCTWFLSLQLYEEKEALKAVEDAKAEAKAKAEAGQQNNNNKKKKKRK